MTVCHDKKLLIVILMNGHYLCMDSRNLVEHTAKDSPIPMNKTKNAESVCSQFRSPYYRFAIGSKKNLYLFQWTTSSAHFVCFREINNGEAPISCLFYHQFVCYSTHKKGFIMHDVRSGNEKKINVPAMPNNIPSMSRISSHYDDDFKVESESHSHSHSGSHSVDDGYLLVQISTSPSLAIFIDKTGNPAQKDTVNWTSAPLMVIDCLQYMVGYLATTNRLEVISLVDQKAVQQIELNASISGSSTTDSMSSNASESIHNTFSPSSHSLNAADSYSFRDSQSEDARTRIRGLFRTASDHIVLFDRDSVSLLVATPIKRQIAECIEHLRIEKGLKLLMKSKPTEDEWRTFQAQSGFALFGNLQWKRAMEHFEISDVDPRDIIYLFPAIKFSGFQYDIQHPAAPQNIMIEELIDSVLSAKRASLSNSNMATLSKQEFAELKHREYLSAIFYLGQFLWKRRSDPPSDDLQIRGAEMTLCVDTALLKIAVELAGDTTGFMRQHSVSSISHSTMPFDIESLLDSDSENACVFTECEKVLISHQQYYHLALFYRSKHQMEKALNALHKIGESHEWEGDEEAAISLTIDILSTLGDSKHLWTYSQWVLLKDARSAMAIYTHSQRRRGGSLFLPFDKVLVYLREDIMANIDGYDCLEHFDFIQFYLEFIARKRWSVAIESEHDNDDDSGSRAKYHDQLAYCYMAKIQRLSAAVSMKARSPSSGIKCASTKLEVVRRKLVEFLEESDFVDNSELLGHAKKFKLYDEMIELNKKLRKHNDVLHTLVVDKGDHGEAIKYCMQTAPSSKDRSDRFLELLRLYFMTTTTSQQLQLQHDMTAEDVHSVDDSIDGVDFGDDLDALKGGKHRKKETINLELLAQEINAENDEFAFMDSNVGSSPSPSPSSPTKAAMGMEFDLDLKEDEQRVSPIAIPQPLPTHTRQRSLGVDEVDMALPTHTRQRSGVIGDDGHCRWREIKAVDGPLPMVDEHEVDGDAVRADFFERGCRILYQYAFEMDPLRVLQLLPPSMDVTFLAEYIGKIMPYVVHKRRIKTISKNLEKRVYLRQRTELAKVRSQYIKMDYGSLCAKCNKRIGNTVFILQPRTLHKFHYSCFYRKRQPQNPQLIHTMTDEMEQQEMARSTSGHEEADSDRHQQSYDDHEDDVGVEIDQRQYEQQQQQSQAVTNPFHAVPSSKGTVPSRSHFNDGFGSDTNGDQRNPFGSNPFSNGSSGSTNPFQGDIAKESASYNPFENSKSVDVNNGNRNNNPFQSDTVHFDRNNPFL